MTEIDRSNSLADLAARIKAEHESVSAALKDSVRHAIAAGELLIEARKQVPHGQWLPWLRDHCAISERMAQRHIRLARNRATIEAKCDTVSDLTINGALALLLIPKNSRDLHEHMTTHVMGSLLDSQRIEDLNLSIAEYEKRKPLWDEALAAFDRAREIDQGDDLDGLNAFIDEVCALVRSVSAARDTDPIEATKRVAQLRDLTYEWLQKLDRHPV